MQPDGRAGHVVSGVQVNVLVKGRAERIGVTRIERDRDVVDVVAGLEVAGDIRRTSLVQWFEWRERSVVAEDDDSRRHRRVDHVARHETTERAMKELQPDGDLSQFLRFGVADDEQMVCADAAPRIARLSGDARESKEDGDNEGYGSFKFHKGISEEETV